MNERKYLGLFSVTSFVDGPEVAEAGRQSGPISDRHRHGSRNTESGGLGGALNIALVGRLQVGFRGPRRAGRVEPTPAVLANAPVATRTPTADQFSGQARDNVGCRL